MVRNILRIVLPGSAFFAGILGLLVIGAHARNRKLAPIWSGLYIGAHTGLSDSRLDSVFDNSEVLGGVPEDAVLGRYFQLDGLLEGLQIGYNWQSVRVVYGIEADWSRLSADDYLLDPNNEGSGTTDSGSVALDWIASLRGRIGISSARSLLYATAGVAWIDGEYTARDDDGAPPGAAIVGPTSLRSVGLVVGGGVEHAVSERLSVRLGGLYYLFNESKDTSTLTNDSDVGDFAKIEDILVARLSANYRLVGAPTAGQFDVLSYLPAQWAGLYAGGHAGYANVRFDGIFDNSEITRVIDLEDSVLGRFFDLDGGVGGLHIGYNRSAGSVIYGVEADWTHLGKSDLLFDPDPESEGTDNAEASVNWLASLRGRAGLSSARTMIFVTAGIAWIDADYRATTADENNVNGGSVNITDTGFVFGVCMEHALTDSWLIRLEGLHYDFGRRIDTSSLNTDADPGDFASVRDITTFRVAVSYKLPTDTN